MCMQKQDSIRNEQTYLNSAIWKMSDIRLSKDLQDSTKFYTFLLPLLNRDSQVKRVFHFIYDF